MVHDSSTTTQSPSEMSFTEQTIAPPLANNLAAFDALKAENDRLKTMILERDTRIATLCDLLNKCTEMLNTAPKKSPSGTNGDGAESSKSFPSAVASAVQQFGAMFGSAAPQNKPTS